MELSLQKIWQEKNLPFHKITLTNGQSIDVIHPGFWNTRGAGPDFQQACLKYDDLLWHGSIEFHVKSSDWYRHRHHLDLAYENVILHVVLEHDQEILINHEVLPTLELKSYLTGDFQLVTRLPKKRNQLLCSKEIDQHKDALLHMQNLALKNRLERKWQMEMNLDQPEISLYKIISRAFGTKTNALSFDLLADQIPFEMLKKMTFQSLISHIQENPQGWKNKNLAMNKTVKKRIEQWIIFVQWFVNAKTEVNSDEVFFWEKGFKAARISNRLLKNNLLINAKTMYLLYQERLTKKNRSGYANTMKHLARIKPENNHITRIWKDAGIHAKNALETQANLEIYQQFCLQMKCLECNIGKRILKL